jgi:predicted Rdx family selenoprotein
LAAEILKARHIEQYIARFDLIPGKGGVFELTINGEVLFSKKALGRHAEPGEIYAAVERKWREVRESLKKDKPLE